jgi:DNA-binding response OmpR family regulator
VLKELRGPKIPTPILMLTAEDSDSNVVVSLDSRVDYFVIKAFEMHVIMARIKALILRSNWDMYMGSSLFTFDTVI